MASGKKTYTNPTLGSDKILKWVFPKRHEQIKILSTIIQKTKLRSTIFKGHQYYNITRQLFCFENFDQGFESDKKFQFFWLFLCLGVKKGNQINFEMYTVNWKRNPSTRSTVICFAGRYKTTQTSQQLFSSSQKAIKLQKHSLKYVQCTCCVYLCMNHSSGQKSI